MVNSCLPMLPVHKESQVQRKFIFIIFCVCSGQALLSDVGFLLNLVVEQISGRDHILNHLSVPAACFTHPEISMVGLTEVSQDYYYLIAFGRSAYFLDPLRPSSLLY